MSKVWEAWDGGRQDLLVPAVFDLLSLFLRLQFRHVSHNIGEGKRNCSFGWETCQAFYMVGVDNERGSKGVRRQGGYWPSKQAVCFICHSWGFFMGGQKGKGNADGGYFYYCFHTPGSGVGVKHLFFARGKSEFSACMDVQFQLPSVLGAGVTSSPWPGTSDNDEEISAFFPDGLCVASERIFFFL